MPASFPASMVNQKRADLGIPNRFSLISSRLSLRRISQTWTIDVAEVRTEAVAA